MGCPVIIADTCGSWGKSDDVHPDENGFVYPCYNIDELANLIKRIATNQEERKNLSANSRRISLLNQKSAHETVLDRLLPLITKRVG